MCIITVLDDPADGSFFYGYTLSTRVFKTAAIGQRLKSAA